MDSWYCRSRNGETGPFSRDELRYLLHSGVIPASAEVRCGTTSVWTPMKDSVFVARTDSRKQMPFEINVSIETNNVNPRKLFDEPPTTPRLKSEPTAVSTVLSRFRNPDHWIAGLVVVALLLMIASVLLWLWWRPIPAGLSEGQSSIATASGDGDGDGPDSTTIEGSSSDAVHLGPRNAKDDSGVPEESKDEVVVASMGEEITKSSEEMPPAEDVAVEDASEPKLIKSSEDSFRIRLPTPDELADTKPNEGKIPYQSPKLRTSNLRGRTGEARDTAIRNSGGSIESERSVALALKWLKSIQQRDGSWSFQQVGPAAQKGSLTSPLAATSLAVLCFLGAGNTTISGPENDVVRRAFDFLNAEIQKATSHQRETMYVYALVMMAVSELAAMEPSETASRKTAKNLLTVIEQAQDPRGGGWRYTPRQAGDLSITGWQIMALQSGKTCGLRVRDTTVMRSNRFLDSVSFESATQYSYTPGNSPTPCMSAVGLLSRIYLGWSRNTKPLRDGLLQLSRVGPDTANIYLNYYATLALHHYGGEPWNTWNEKLRPLLIEGQIIEGDAAGSWAVTDPHGHSGGQIYQTCLSVLCLEVYYRYLPIFDDETQ